jgi:DNA-binding CsgD family transcriptional regulator
MLSERDVRGLLDYVGECYSIHALDELRQGMLPGLRRLVPCDIVSYNEANFTARHMIARDDPVGSMTDDAADQFLRYGHQNPLVGYFQQPGVDGRPRKWSDFITRRELHATDLYRNAYEPMGVEYQMAFALPSAPELLIGLALNRGKRDFTERDFTVVNMVRPHLVRAYVAAREYEALGRRLAALERGMSDAGRGLVLLGPGGSVEFASESAVRVLGSEGLPDEVGEWLRAQADRRNSLDGAPPLFYEGPQGRAVVHLLPARTEGEQDSLVVEASAEALGADALRGLGLTARQAEVLRLVALGEPTGAIARTLGISARTVEKHLQAIFERLGVRSRSAAAATAWAGVRAATPLD